MVLSRLLPIGLALLSLVGFELWFVWSIASPVGSEFCWSSIVVMLLGSDGLWLGGRRGGGGRGAGSWSCLMIFGGVCEIGWCLGCVVGVFVFGGLVCGRGWGCVGCS